DEDDVLALKLSGPLRELLDGPGLGAGDADRGALLPGNGFEAGECLVDIVWRGDSVDLHIGGCKVETDGAGDLAARGILHRPVVDEQEPARLYLLEHRHERGLCRFEFR